ncbi:MAG TPA: hypothetical protein VFE62_20380 [Gemmataceae bacterium]|nr:hypothetical protein [Gemmataceae bacterium]
MRLRCPAENCPIELPDDLLGSKIRCPHCGTLILIDAKYRESASPQIREGEPAGAPEKPDPREPSNLENQIYDGLPPLAVMMALRRRGGKPAYDQDELNQRYPMTDDDWKALAAFEKALHASVSLTNACWIGTMGLLANAMIWWILVDGTNNHPVWLRWTVLFSAGVMLVAGICVYCGIERMRRIVLDEFLLWVPTCSLALSATFALWIGIDLLIVCTGSTYHGDAPAAGVGLVGNLMALIAVSIAGLRSSQALTLVKPPEIAHRLVEALKYLA